MQIFQNIDTFLQSNNGHINFTCGNLGSTNLAKNLAISASQCSTKIVFFALDKASIEEMKNYCDIIDFSSFGFGINEDFLHYRTSDFNAISFARYHIAEFILNAGKSLTYIDIDCVVKNNFESDILSKLKMQPEHLHIQGNLKNKPCTGFFALTPAFDSLIFNQFIMQQKPKYDDQRFLWNLMETHNIKLNLLDNNLYPNGLMYYSNHQKIDDQCYIIHFNCVQGEANKINKIKQFGYWYLS